MKNISNGLIDIYGELVQATSWITAKDLTDATNLSRATVNRCLNYLIYFDELLVRHHVKITVMAIAQFVDTSTKKHGKMQAYTMSHDA
ncbi:hypothetical protein LC609_32495 [Nostoc sp. XA013]|nr:hypothetical protein [Nostoc sp. XA013]